VSSAFMPEKEATTMKCPRCEQTVGRVRFAAENTHTSLGNEGHFQVAAYCPCGEELSVATVSVAFKDGNVTLTAFQN